MSESKPFEPTYMSVGVLTAALQELTPRGLRDPDPDLAIEDWLQFAADVGADSIELSAALLFLMRRKWLMNQLTMIILK